MEVQVRILGNMVGYYFTDVGPLNQVVHLWGYESMNDRYERRAGLPPCGLVIGRYQL